MAATDRQIAALSAGFDYGASSGHAVLRELRPRDRAVFRLRVFGFTWREITGVMKGNVRKLQQRYVVARDRLTATLGAARVQDSDDDDDE